MISHNRSAIGVLVTNLGTPDAPTPAAVKRYLAEFLSDSRVVEIPNWLWKPILHGIVLQVRPKRSAANYQKIWTEKGSPLLYFCQLLTLGLQSLLNEQLSQPVKIVLGMRYGNPSIAKGLTELQAAGCRRILILPLYPQYSATTTGSTFDAVATFIKRQRNIPELRMIQSYADDAGYINAVADKIRRHWQTQGQGDHLLFSFHGLPKRCIELGDPYADQCHTTANLITNNLGLPKEKWSVAFQSRFGKAEWLQPYCDKTLQQMPAQGIKHIDVICPGFAVDCLETLEEIALQNRDLFLQAGGKRFAYIPALNDDILHQQTLANLITKHLQGWL